MNRNAHDSFVWEMFFKIPYTKLNDVFSSNDVFFIPSKDENNVTLVKVKVSTSNYNLDESKSAAKLKVNKLLDAYSILFGSNLSIEYIDRNLLKTPKLPLGTKLYMPSSAERPITVSRLISNEEFNECQNFSNKIKKRKDAKIYEKIISWYRKGLESRDPYDRFLYTWIAFNALYNHLSEGRGERTRIKNLIRSYLTIKKGEPIFINNANDFITLSNADIVLRDGMNCSNALKDSITNEDYDSAIINGILCVYGVRCDLFHGGEALSNSSRELVQKACRILDNILRNCILSFI